MGREQWFLTPKDGISLLGIRSKIERQGVLKRETRVSLFFFVPRAEVTSLGPLFWGYGVLVTPRGGGRW